jgi:hypothetical protein
LGDDAAHACRRRCAHQIVRAFDPQAPVGLLPGCIARRARRVWQVRELMDNRVRLRTRHRSGQGIRVERINNDRLDAQRLQAGSRRRVTRRAGHVVLCVPQQESQPPPNNTRRACEENPHR